MLTRFDEAQHTLERATKIEASGWTHVVDPTEHELAMLADSGLPASLFRHALDVDELARVDHDGPVTLVVLRVPWHRPASPELPYRTVALGVIMTGDRVVTLSRHDTGLAAAVAPDLTLRPGHPTHILLRLVAAVADRFLAHVHAIDAVVNETEGRLKSSLANREVLDLLKYQKALVHLSTALGSNKIMLERLGKDPHVTLDDVDRDLLDDLMVELHQATQQTQISVDILSNLMDAFASIISNNLNVVMKALTSLTLILTAPMLAGTLYGMNVALPGQRHPYAFVFVVSGSIVASVIVAVVFWRKRWL